MTKGMAIEQCKTGMKVMASSNYSDGWGIRIITKGDNLEIAEVDNDMIWVRKITPGGFAISLKFKIKPSIVYPA